MKKDKKVLTLIICIVAILLALLVIFFTSMSKNIHTNEENTTTTTTKAVVKTKNIIDTNSGISVKLNEEKYFEHKLVVKNIDLASVKIDNVKSVYDIKLVDINNNVVKVNNANLIISIPFENTENNTDFKVLYLSETNEVLETYTAKYENGKVIFTVKHLSRYAIVATKQEEQSTTTTTTTKKTITNNQDTTKKPQSSSSSSTTQKPKTEPPTKKPTTTQPTTKKPTTTQPTTTTTTTTKPTTTTTTTQKVKTYAYKWSADGDQGGKYYLYVVDENGTPVAGTVTLTSKETGKSASFDIPANGRLFVKDNYTVSNPKGN